MHKTIKKQNMTKKILFGLMAFVLMTACNNLKSDEATPLTTAEFASQAPDLLDKKVTIEGTIMHVCKHGGKKMFLNDDRVKIVVSENIASFDPSLEGSDIVLTGIIKEEMVVPVLSEETEMKHKSGEKKEKEEKAEIETEEVKAEGDGEEVKAEDCDMEEAKTLYVIEVIEFIEKEK